MSQRVWRMFVRGEFRIPGETADVEVLTERRHGNQTAEARYYLELARARGLVPRRPRSGATYRLPLSVTRGCWDCNELHAEEKCRRRA